MAHFAFIAPPFSGHLNPMQVLARTLVARGHRATFVQQADAESLLYPASAEINFLPVGQKTHPPGDLARTVGHINALNGLFGMGAVLRDVARRTDMLCREAPEKLRAIGIDAIVADQTEAAGGLIARHLDLPCVSVANALPINAEPGIPPPFTTWRFDPSPAGRRRNIGGYRVADWLSFSIRRTISTHAAAWKLGRLRTLEDCLSPQAQISQMVSQLDFPREESPSGFHYVGPLREPDATRELPPRGDNRKFVLVTFGTLQGNRERLFRAVALACRKLGLGCVIAHGGRLSAADAASLATIATVRDFVPQREILRCAAAAVTHAGMNTVLDAMSFGVPVLCIPLAFEQAAIAARVEHAGAGVVLRPHAVNAASVAAALHRMLDTDACRSRALILRRAIAASGGAPAAADIVEHVLEQHPTNLQFGRIKLLVKTES